MSRFNKCNISNHQYLKNIGERKIPSEEFHPFFADYYLNYS